MKEATERHIGVFNQAHNPAFKPWMRKVAFVILFCFLWQDVSAAYGPDLATSIHASLSPYRLPQQGPLGLSFLIISPSVYAHEFGNTNLSKFESPNQKPPSPQKPPSQPSYTPPPQVKQPDANNRPATRGKVSFPSFDSAPKKQSSPSQYANDPKNGVIKGVDFKNLRTQNADGTWINHNKWSFSKEAQERTGINPDTARQYFWMETHQSTPENNAHAADLIKQHFAPAINEVNKQGWNNIAQELSKVTNYGKAVEAMSRGMQTTDNALGFNSSALIVASGYGLMFLDNDSAQKLLDATASIIQPGNLATLNRINRLGFDYQGVGNVPQANDHFGSVNLPDGNMKYLFTEGGLYRGLSALGARDPNLKNFDGWFAKNVADPMFKQGMIDVSNVSKIQNAWGNPFQIRGIDYTMTSGHNIKGTYQFSQDLKADMQKISPMEGITDFSANVTLNQIQRSGETGWHNLKTFSDTSKILLKIEGLSGNNALYTHSGEVGKISKLENGLTAFNGQKGTTYVETKLANLQDNIQGKLTDVKYSANFKQNVYAGFDNPSGDLAKLAGIGPSFVGTADFAGLTTRVNTLFSSELYGVVSAKLSAAGDGCNGNNCPATSGGQGLETTKGLIEKTALEGISYLQVRTLEGKSLNGIDLMGSANGKVLFGERPNDLNSRMKQIDNSWFSPIQGTLENHLFKPEMPESNGGNDPKKTIQNNTPFTVYQSIDGQIGFTARIEAALGQDQQGNLKLNQSAWLQPSLVDSKGFGANGTKITIPYINDGNGVDVNGVKNYEHGLALPWNVRMVGNPDTKEWRDLKYSNVVFYGKGEGQIAVSLTDKPTKENPTRGGWEYGGDFKVLEFSENTYGGKARLETVNWVRDFQAIEGANGFGHFSNQNVSFDKSSYSLDGTTYANAIVKVGDALVLRDSALNIIRNSADFNSSMARGGADQATLSALAKWPSADIAPYQSIVFAEKALDPLGKVSKVSLTTPIDKIDLPVAINPDGTITEKQFDYGIGINLSPNMGAMQASLKTDNMVFAFNANEANKVILGDKGYFTVGTEDNKTPTSAVMQIQQGFIPFHKNDAYQAFSSEGQSRAIRFSQAANGFWEKEAIQPLAINDGKLAGTGDDFIHQMNASNLKHLNKGNILTGWQNIQNEGRIDLYSSYQGDPGKAFWDAKTEKVVLTRGGDPIYLFQTEGNDGFYSISPFLFKGGQPGKSDNLGLGTIINIEPTAKGSDVNWVSGTFGVMMNSPLMMKVTDAEGKVTTQVVSSFDANTPMFSEGAVWKTTPRFETETTSVGKDAAGKDIVANFADRSYGVHYAPDIWLGHLSDQTGYLQIGANGQFYGNAASIKDYAYGKPYYTIGDKTTAGAFYADLTRLDLVNKFNTTLDSEQLKAQGIESLNADTIGRVPEQLLAANTASSVDWDLSYAVGEGKIHGKDFKVFDIGEAYWDNETSGPILGVKSDYFNIPELYADNSKNSSSGDGLKPDGPKIVSTSFNPDLTLLGRSQFKLPTETSEGKVIFRRVNLASGITAILLQPTVPVQIDGKEEKSFFDPKDGKFYANGDISALSLSEFAKWSGVPLPKKNSDGSVVMPTDGLAYSVSLNKDGGVTRVSLVLNPDAKNTNYLSLGEHNALGVFQNSNIYVPQVKSQGEDGQWHDARGQYILNDWVNGQRLSTEWRDLANGRSVNIIRRGDYRKDIIYDSDGKVEKVNMSYNRQKVNVVHIVSLGEGDNAKQLFLISGMGKDNKFVLLLEDSQGRVLRGEEMNKILAAEMAQDKPDQVKSYLGQLDKLARIHFNNRNNPEGKGTHQLIDRLLAEKVYNQTKADRAEAERRSPSKVSGLAEKLKARDELLNPNGIDVYTKVVKEGQTVEAAKHGWANIEKAKTLLDSYFLQFAEAMDKKDYEKAGEFYNRYMVLNSAVRNAVAWKDIEVASETRNWVTKQYASMSDMLSGRQSLADQQQLSTKSGSPNALTFEQVRVEVNKKLDPLIGHLGDPNFDPQKVNQALQIGPKEVNLETVLANYQLIPVAQSVGWGADWAVKTMIGVIEYSGRQNFNKEGWFSTSVEFEGNFLDFWLVSQEDSSMGESIRGAQSRLDGHIDWALGEKRNFEIDMANRVQKYFNGGGGDATVGFWTAYSFAIYSTRNGAFNALGAAWGKEGYKFDLGGASGLSDTKTAAWQLGTSPFWVAGNAYFDVADRAVSAYVSGVLKVSEGVASLAGYSENADIINKASKASYYYAADLYFAKSEVEKAHQEAGVDTAIDGYGVRGLGNTIQRFGEEGGFSNSDLNFNLFGVDIAGEIMDRVAVETGWVVNGGVTAVELLPSLAMMNPIPAAMTMGLGALTDVWANNYSYSQQGKFLSGSDHASIITSFLAAPAIAKFVAPVGGVAAAGGNFVSRTANWARSIIAAPATVNWANAFVGMGHVQSMYATGKPASIESSIQNILTTYAFMGVGDVIGKAGRFVYNSAIAPMAKGAWGATPTALKAVWAGTKNGLTPAIAGGLGVGGWKLYDSGGDWGQAAKWGAAGLVGGFAATWAIRGSFAGLKAAAPKLWAGTQNGLTTAALGGLGVGGWKYYQTGDLSQAAKWGAIGLAAGLATPWAIRLGAAGGRVLVGGIKGIPSSLEGLSGFGKALGTPIWWTGVGLGKLGSVTGEAFSGLGKVSLSSAKFLTRTGVIPAAVGYGGGFGGGYGLA
ncbi:MAG: hypothetical protein KKH93_06180, partial [Candidatus Omnitrophica bacterium]|nr:hypothetical protein [Candidatus Omnitrophota bacterium]